MPNLLARKELTTVSLLKDRHLTNEEKWKASMITILANEFNNNNIHYKYVQVIVKSPSNRQQDIPPLL